MPGAGVFRTNAADGTDGTAAVMTLRLASGGRGASERFFFASRVVLRTGAEPSYALSEVPILDYEETAPAIAARAGFASGRGGDRDTSERGGFVGHGAGDAAGGERRECAAGSGQRRRDAHHF